MITEFKCEAEIMTRDDRKIETRCRNAKYVP